MTAFQLLRYMVRIWEKVLLSAKVRQLPAIVPIVLYHGQRTWQAASQFSALIAAPAALQPYVPNFGYQLCDLSRDELKDLQGQATLQIALLLFKYIFTDELSARLSSILALFRTLLNQQRDGLGYLETVLRYLAQAADKLDEGALQQALNEALPAIGGTIMPTLAETWIEQGMQKGMQEGMQEGLQQGELLTLKRQLIKRFGPLPTAIEQRLAKAGRTELEAWLDQVLDAPSLEAMFPSE